MGVAAGWAGISERSFMNWMARGRRAAESRDEDNRAPDRADAPFVELYEQVARARAQAALHALTQIRDAARDKVVREKETTWHDPETGEVVRRLREVTIRPGDWRASAWWLERTFPQHYGRNAQGIDAEWSAAASPQPAPSAGGPDMTVLAERLKRTLESLSEDEA